MNEEESKEEFDAGAAVEMDADATDTVDLVDREEEEGAEEAVGTAEDIRDRSWAAESTSLTLLAVDDEDAVAMVGLGERGSSFNGEEEADEEERGELGCVSGELGAKVDKVDAELNEVRGELDDNGGSLVEPSSARLG